MNNVLALTRVNFLPLTIVIVFAGLAASFFAQHTLNVLDGLLVLAGALLTHASVNAFNNYFDYRSGIDRRTRKTPFSGGVEILVNGKMTSSSAFMVALISLVGAGMVGAYFLIRLFSVLFPLVLFGAIAIVLYSPVVSKIHGLSEVVAGSGFGLMGLGTYVTQTGIINGPAIAIFVPVTILVALLLFLNEFPDTEVDKESGRRHLVVLLGKKKAAGLYIAGLAATYISIVLAVLVGYSPIPVLISLATVPIACKAGSIVLKNYDRTMELIPAMGSNVLTILVTILLIGVGYAVGAFL